MITAIGLVICLIGMLIGYGLFRFLLGLTIIVAVGVAFAAVYVALNEPVPDLEQYAVRELLVGAGLLGLVVGFAIAPLKAIHKGLQDDEPV